MRIKKIELIGFKSFKDRTVIQFDAGITGVVGPNGCGKSNIVDALVWVMGEMSAKDLRGSTMTDVIFAGAEGYAPSGMAEVSLTLENDGGPFPVQYLKHTEIMVTRRLHRNGESEYLINKEPARLRDVQEIFMDTGAGSKGFSIIQQGMIGKIITAKPEDRKSLIEEAAGITKFKARKKESQRKLQSTEQNLIRLQDIIGELKRQIDSLQRQAQRAERYRTLKTQIEELDLWVSSLSFRDLKLAADECQRIFNEVQSQEVEGEASLSSLQSEIEVLRLGLLEKEKSVEILQNQQFEIQASVQKKELDIQSLRFEIEQARTKGEMTGSLVQVQEVRRDSLLKEQATLESQVGVLELESDTLAQAFIMKNEAFQEAQSRIAQVDEELTTSRRELFALGQTDSQIDARVHALTSQIEEMQEREQAEQGVFAELKQKQIEFEDRRKRIQLEFDRERQMQMDLSSDVESFEANKKILSGQIAQKKTEFEEFKDRLNEVASRLYGLEDLARNFEGFEEGVKSVMLWQKARSTEITADGSVSFQPVSEVVEVPPEYEVAMEAALGSRLQMLLSRDEGTAVQAVEYLKEHNSGRASFAVGSQAQHERATLQDSGVLAVLKDVVHFSDQHQSSVEKLLDGVAVVDSLKTALRLHASAPGWTFVTRDGDTLTNDGILTGGASEGADSGMLKRRREIKELSQQKDEWAGKLALAQGSLKKLEATLENVVADFEGARARKLEQELKVSELRKDLERSENEMQNAAGASEKQQRELNRLMETIRAQQSRLEELETALLETRGKKAQVEQKTNELQEELTTTRMGFDGINLEVTDLQVQSARKTQEFQSTSRELERVKREVDSLQVELSRMNEESEKTTSVLSQSQILLEERKLEFEKSIRDLEEIKARFAQTKNTYEEMHARVRESEDSLSSAQRIRNERQHRMNEAQLKFEQAKMKEQYLIDQIRERYMLNLPDIFEEKSQREGDPTTAEAELKEMRDKLAKIGEVNLSAIEEYEENSKRYEFLVQQQADLNGAQDQLRRVIDRINRICSKRFKETFDLVNERFMRVFPVLFGGGEAHLEIFEDPEKGEMGIDIIAKPPGKKMQNISLLSGGEKALTAVALVFSIFLVKPSPYCLLDEVDAPLDDANVYRFNDLVREMAKRSQIIVVTHNKHTMEIASKLYGVTMQERGVSTMVSVNLNEAEEVLTPAHT